jgi:hypothetical protein
MAAATFSATCTRSGSSEVFMSSLTCDYCGESDNEKGSVQAFENDMYRMHLGCYLSFKREQREED